MIALSKILNVTFDNLVSEHKISDEPERRPFRENREILDKQA